MFGYQELTSLRSVLGVDSDYPSLQAANIRPESLRRIGRSQSSDSLRVSPHTLECWRGEGKGPGWNISIARSASLGPVFPWMSASISSANISCKWTRKTLNAPSSPNHRRDWRHAMKHNDWGWTFVEEDPLAPARGIITGCLMGLDMWLLGFVIYQLVRWTMKPISTWLVWLGPACLWVATIAIKLFLNGLAILFMLAVLTVLMLGMAEQYQYRVVPEIARDYYERGKWHAN